MKNKFFTREICVCAHLTQTRYAQRVCAEMRIIMSDEIPSMKEILEENDSQKKEEMYNEYVDEITPKNSPVKNVCKAFFVGGLICVLGEGLNQLYQFMGQSRENAALFGMLTLILLSVVLTGLNIYPKLAQFAGAGTVVPITGFANSVVSPAIEFQKEGQVFGIGCKIFNISGPVILYGIFSRWVLGMLYWIAKVSGWM